MRYALLFSGALVFAVLYSPQPLLPGIERLYGAPPGSAGLGMALPLLGLVLGPWCFRRWAAPGEQKLFWGTLGVGVFSLVSLVVPGLVWWALARFLVGFALSAVAVLGFALLPRLFPSPYAVSAFVALNALGGTLGRFLAGVLGEGLGVRPALLIISLPVLILAGFFLTGRAPPLPEPRAARPGRAMLVGGALLFSNLFLANLFPYRLEALGFGLGAIGGFYLAYLGGLVGPFVSGKWGLKAALGLVFLGASLMAGPWLGVGFALFLAGIFGMHAVFGGVFGRRGESWAYVSGYYLGGALAGLVYPLFLGAPFALALGTVIVLLVASAFLGAKV